MAGGTTTRASVREVAARLVDHGVTASEAYSRPDLAERLRAAGIRVEHPDVRVLVVGEYKQGKSSLVNALAGVDVCPVADDAATVVPVAVHWAEAPSAVAVVVTDDGVERVAIAPGALRDWVVEREVHADERSVRLVEVGVPAGALARGLVLVDMPGVGGLGSFTGALALAALPSADAVLFVSDAGQELTETELDLVRRLARGSAPVAVVKSRTDIHPAWSRVLEADALHTDQIARAAFRVSSDLVTKARESADPELEAESAIPDLAAWLHREVVVDVTRRRALAVTDEVERATAALAAPLRTERAGLDDPERISALSRDLDEAKARADRLRSASGRWQQTLNDLFADISGDADHGLRSAAREVLASAEAAIDEFDPATGWEAYEPQLRRQVSELVATHYEELNERVTAATQGVSSVFSDDAAAADQLVAVAGGEIRADDRLASYDDALAVGELARRSVGGQALVLVRSSYGGVLMAGFVGSVVGLVATPAVLAVGLALGTKGLREENQRQLAQRRAQAKASARRFVDEVLFNVGKDSRDTVRLAQRGLRDFFSGTADELSRAVAAALDAAQRAAKQDAASRDARRRDVVAELGRLDWLAERCREVRVALQDGEV